MIRHERTRVNSRAAANVQQSPVLPALHRLRQRAPEKRPRQSIAAVNPRANSSASIAFAHSFSRSELPQFAGLPVRNTFSKSRHTGRSLSDA